MLVFPFLQGRLSAAPAEDVAVRAPKCPAFTRLCVNADKTGVFDLTAGTAELEGNVAGYDASQDLTFNAGLLQAFRSGDGEWKRLLLSSNVKMVQDQRRVSADHGVIEEWTALFYGDARMADALARSESDEVVLEREPWRATLRGSSQNPVRMEYAAPVGHAAQMAGAAGETPAPETPPPQPARARAQKAVVEEQSHQVTLTGQVWVEIPEKQLQMQAENVVLQFGEDNSVTGFQARGDVVITQPGRRLTSDSARSQNRMQTILLQGRARAQQEGQFELASERMEVFTDPKKGAVRSEDRQRPITTSLDLAAGRPLRLDQARLQALREKGVPLETVQKLTPLAGRTFAGQEALRKAVGELLTPEESQRYLPLVIAQAR